jgi:hemerythrin
MNWTVTYLVGVPQLDKDHEVIFEELEKLYNLLKEGGSQEDMLEQALLVRKEARLHFAGEEALMEWLGYHEIDLHIAEHKMLMDQINSLLDEIREGLLPSEKEL